MPITIDIPSDLEARIRYTAKQKGIDVNHYIANVLEQNTASNAVTSASLEEAELDLIQKINRQSLTQEEWDRYNDLKIRRANETLNEEEQKEIIQFSTKLEELNVTRIHFLLELATLKGMTLDEVMAYLGIQGVSYE